jgi:drug/metabolite transporter (DMT)-like permease
MKVTHKSNHRNAFIALFIASIIWGATAPIMKLTITSMPLFILAFLRFGVAALILFPFVAKQLDIKRQHVPLLIISSLCGITFNITFFFLGLSLTSALNASVISASVPLFTLLLAHLMLKEKLQRRVVIGALLGILGILVIIGKGFFQGGVAFSPIGDFFLLMSAFTFVMYEIFSKELFAQYKPLPIAFYALLIGAVSFLPAAVYERYMNPLWLDKITPDTRLGIAYGILLSSLAAYCLWQWGLSKIEASRVGFFVYLHPIVGTITAVLLLSEKITPLFIVGSLCIFCGLFVAEGIFHFYPKKHHS